MEIWLWEFAKAIGRFCLHPIFYYFLCFSFVLAYFRIKRERQLFHTRIFDRYHELRTLLPTGLVLGLLFSIITILVGTTLPVGTIFLVALMTIFATLPLQARLLSPAYTVGLTFIFVLFLSKYPIDLPYIRDIGDTNLLSLSVIFVLLLIAEGIFMTRSAKMSTTPILKQSKRGLSIGAHVSQRLLVVPLFLFMPGDALTSQFSWWPTFAHGDQSYSLMLVPFGLGFKQVMQGTKPVDSLMKTGKELIIHALFVMLFLIGTYWYAPIAIVAAAFAIIGREIITLRQKMNDDASPSYFSKSARGLKILSFIPHSPSERMELRIGEVITRVNGVAVNTVQDFYKALQKNRAHCKLEVVDEHGHNRFVQRALYDGEHHQLGIIFVPGEKEKWDPEAV